MTRLEVDPDVLTELDRSFAAAAFSTLQLAIRAQRAAVEPALLAAAPLDPLGVARSVLRIEGAVAGRAGLLGSAGALGADATELATAAASYAAADAAVGASLDVRAAAVTGAALSARMADLAVASLAPYAEDGLHQGERSALQIVGMPRPVADSIATAERDAVGVSLRAWAARLPDGPGDATSVGPPAAGAVVPATNLGDYLASVDRLCDGQGHIAVVAIDGSPPRYVVLLPGVATLGSTPYPQDLPGAAVAEELGDSAYSRGVRQAIDAAGVPVGAAVMLVGHSQGGIVAMNLAGDHRFNGGRVAVTHVVAAGSPISTKPLPAGAPTRVMSLENRADLVTHLDLDRAPVPVDPRRRTVYGFTRQTGSVVGNHDLAETYAPVAGHATGSVAPKQQSAAAAASARFTADPAVADYLRSAQPYLDGAPVRTQYFQLTDRPSAALPRPRPSE
jgi:pimeloyl-ACP methyl ester carboxylesterase